MLLELSKWALAAASIVGVVANIRRLAAERLGDDRREIEMTRHDAPHDRAVSPGENVIRRAYFRGWLDARGHAPDCRLPDPEIELAVNQWHAAREELTKQKHPSTWQRPAG
jgi:hypothetical protein